MRWMEMPAWAIPSGARADERTGEPEARRAKRIVNLLQEAKESEKTMVRAL